MWVSASPPGPVSVCGVHLFRLLYGFGAHVGRHRPRPILLHRGLSEVQLEVYRVADGLGGGVDLAAGDAHQLPAPTWLEQRGIRGPHVQLCRQLVQ